MKSKWVNTSYYCRGAEAKLKRTLPVKVSVQGLIPANRLEVPKSEIFNTPL